MPDPFLRAAIWKSHIPPSVKVASDVDFNTLALKYELTGGFIKSMLQQEKGGGEGRMERGGWRGEDGEGFEFEFFVFTLFFSDTVLTALSSAIPRNVDEPTITVLAPTPFSLSSSFSCLSFSLLSPLLFLLPSPPSFLSFFLIFLLSDGGPRARSRQSAERSTGHG